MYTYCVRIFYYLSCTVNQLDYSNVYCQYPRPHPRSGASAYLFTRNVPLTLPTENLRKLACDVRISPHLPCTDLRLSYHSPQRVLHSVLCNRVLLLILRQRSSANMTARIPVGGAGANQSAIFTSFIDDEVSANLTFTTPTVGSVAVSSTYVATSSKTATRSQSLQVQSPDTSYVDV